MVTDAGVELSHAEFGAFFYNVIRDRWRGLHPLHAFRACRENRSQSFQCPEHAIFEPTFRGPGPCARDDILADPRYGKMRPTRECPRDICLCGAILPFRFYRDRGEVLADCSSVMPGPASSASERNGSLWHWRHKLQ